MSLRDLEEKLNKLTVDEIKAKLLELTIKQAEAFYYRLQKKSAGDISDVMTAAYGKSISSGTVEGLIREAYKKVDLDTGIIHSSQIKGVLERYYEQPFIELIDNDPEKIPFVFKADEAEETAGPLAGDELEASEEVEEERNKAEPEIKAERSQNEKSDEELKAEPEIKAVDRGIKAKPQEETIKAEDPGVRPAATVLPEDEPTVIPRAAIIIASLLALCLFGIVLVRAIENVPDRILNILAPPAPQTLESPLPQDTITSTSPNTEPVASQTSLPSSTATSSTETSQPTVSPTQPPTETTVPLGPSGDWAVRIYRTDDANIFLVNNHIVTGTFLDQTTDWVNINRFLQDGEPNFITAVSLNHAQMGYWGFSLKRNNVTVWGHEGDVVRCKLCYAQTVQITPENTVSEVNLRQFDKQNLSGAWSARVVANDFGVLMVNGVVGAAGYGGSELDLGWFDISGLLYEGQENIITAAVWNQDGEYSWDFAIRKGETVLWGPTNTGSGQRGEVFFTTVIIDGAGNIVP